MQKAVSTEPLAQMFRSIASQRRTGLLRIEQFDEGGREQGEIYFEDGHPRRAQTYRETGEAAFQCIRSWKNITYSFYGIGSPYPGQLLALPAPQEPRTENEPLVRRPPSSLVQTDHLPRVSPSTSQRDTGPQPVLDVQSSLEAGAKARTSVSQRSITQPLVKNPLEESVPSQPPTTPPSKRRLTTRLVPNTLTPMPRSEPMPEGRPLLPLPGRQAVFKRCTNTTLSGHLKQLERRERIIFILLDGKRTIQDVARLTHCSETEVELAVVRLTMRGYTMQVPKPQPAPTLQEKLVDLFSHPTQNMDVQ